MKAIQLAEHTSPLDAQQAQQFNSLIETLSPAQVTWISGYLAGINAAAIQGEIAEAQPNAVLQNIPSETLTILYGSQTGNAEDLAAQLGEQATARGLTVRVVDMLDYKLKELKKETHIAVVVSTQGEGDPPDNAEELYEFIYGKKAPKLDGVRFSVLALGDTSYESYCHVGRDFDTRLEELGGQRVVDRGDLDIDYEDDAHAWIDKALGVYVDELGNGGSHPTVTPMPRPASAAGQPVADSGQWSRKNPFSAEVLDNIVLNARGSKKEVHHIELDTEDSGLTWEPGDSLGIIPENNARVVEDLVNALQLDPEQTVSGVDGDVSLRHALSHQYEITTLTRPLIEKYAQLIGSAPLHALLAEDRRAELTEYMDGRFLIDLVEQFPEPSLTANDLVNLLRKLPPRLYSIASSHAANPDELHLTVAAVRYATHGREREGVASVQLADRSGDKQLPIYIDRNKNFKLPDDNSVPVIMVGPGTGVAPFRAFMEEREERDASGQNWLLFGAQHFRSDFYYQNDWLRWRKAGLLTRVDVAFSRDQEQKVYVQDRLRESGADLFDWLERGAYVYVCGDANAMARDVHDTLVDVIGKYGALEPEAAASYLKQMQKEKRYQRDVY